MNTDKHRWGIGSSQNQSILSLSKDADVRGTSVIAPFDKLRVARLRALFCSLIPVSYSLVLIRVHLCLSVVSFLLVCSSLFAADHINTDQDLPIQVEDAYPVEYRAVELQLATRYEDPDQGSGRFVFIPEVKWGAFRNTHLWVQGELLTNKGDEENTAEFGLLYNFNTETRSTPAFSISPRVETAFDGSVDLTIRGIVTKSCGENRFNLNADYIDVGDPEPGERDSLYFIGLGWDRSMNLDTVLLADVFTRRSETEGEENEWMAELGLRYQLDPSMVLATGVGVGLSGGPGSNDLTVTLGAQRSF